MIITKIFIYHFRDKSPRCGKGKPTQYLHVCLILPTTSKSLSLGQIQWALVFFISQTDLSPLNTLTDSSTFVFQSTTSNCEKLTVQSDSALRYQLSPHTTPFFEKGSPTCLASTSLCRQGQPPLSLLSPPCNDWDHMHRLGIRPRASSNARQAPELRTHDSAGFNFLSGSTLQPKATTLHIKWP